MAGGINIINSSRAVQFRPSPNVVQLKAQRNLVKVPNAAGLVVNVTVQQSSTRINQSSPAATWILSHSLGRVPIVQVYLDSGELVGADVTASSTTISVTFAQATSGFITII
jgi:hypothetical protein